MTLISAAQLRLMSLRCDYTALAPLLDREAARCEINTPRRIAHWLAHLHVESAGYTVLEENLSYSAERLVAVWPKRFPSIAAATPFARNPRALANKVYGGRMGNKGPDDGWKFRGRSFTCLTGADNYRMAKQWTGLDLLANPDAARRPDVAAKIAADFWRVNDLNAVADADPGEVAMSKFASLADWVRTNEADDCRGETQVINGGQIGAQDRLNMLIRARGIWRDA